ncbi:23Sr RNA [Winogradskyella psychrotolerans RS-3]|uniref:23Sr RNA n=1 Tax=Winogradskyella psychrotolerans RS-3 TaxID=641526 RepID=S7X6T9_9FLAO|nr:four helix bundle protein [Winogradskyella psychrotolerans]EPR74779.1 23Sr RNA [Winogradskyella psychrotolerans RS-3]
MTHKDLEVYKLSLNLVEEIYKLTKGFPSSENFGLTSQLRRAAVSLPSNIAEGSSRGSTKDFIRFLNIASGSLAEIETQLVIAERIGYITFDDTLQNNSITIRKMLYRLKQALSKKLSK